MEMPEGWKRLEKLYQLASITVKDIDLVVSTPLSATEVLFVERAGIEQERFYKDLRIQHELLKEMYEALEEAKGHVGYSIDVVEKARKKFQEWK